jgi:hypothetical protein
LVGESGSLRCATSMRLVAGGTSWSRKTVAKTMLRMTLPARRPPYVRLERAVNRYRIRWAV